MPLSFPDHQIQINYAELARRRHARWWMMISLILSDLLSLSLAFWIAIWLRSTLPGGSHLPAAAYADLIIGLALFPLIYSLMGLYPTVGLSPVDELRHLAHATSILFIFFTALTFWLPAVLHFSRLVVLFAWPISLFLVQFNRWLLRIAARRIGFWGEAVIIFGRGSETRYVEEYLRNSIRLGIRPVAVIDGFHPPDERLGHVIESTGIRTAILILSEISEEMRHQVVDLRQFRFHRLILISSLGSIGSLGVSTYDLEGLLGLGVRQNLLNRWEGLQKRCLDLIIVSAGALLIAPFWLVLSLLIRLDSPGKVLYSQNRKGRGGKDFRILKFRTMVENADQVLDQYLSANPELQAEWESIQKIKNDPRVTRVGKFLRKFSLDELPQIWNVFIGEMSLVGPRPIVEAETQYYKHVFSLYEMVRPGISGLWQVSGRSDIGYDARVRYDEYYIRNWSVWLDIYILLRTVWVVISQRGAY